MNLFSIAFSLFLLIDAVGNIPLFISFLKGINPARQRAIILREMVIALFIILLFSFAGELLMSFLQITPDTIQIAGGIILFILALKMVFPPAHDPNEALPHDSEPFIVPLAIPLVAGPAVLAAVIIYTNQEANHLIMMGAIMLAWGASLLILILAPSIQKIFGSKGITALERLMGLLLTLIGIQMLMNGVSSFITRQTTG